MTKSKIFQEEKKFWKSKTFWINVFVVISGVTSLLAGELQAGVPLTVAGVANIVLRAVTKAKITV
jgi:siroheme synthase